MCTVVDIPTSILACLFAALMFTGFHNQFPLLTMVKISKEVFLFINPYSFPARSLWHSYLCRPCWLHNGEHLVLWIDLS